MNLNIGSVDRAVRIVGGLGLILLAAMGLIGAWGYIGMLPLLTGMVRTCPAYSLLGIGPRLDQAQETDMSLTQGEHATQLLDALLRRRDGRGLVKPVLGRSILEDVGANPRAGVMLGQARSLLDYICTVSEVPLVGQLILLGKEDGWDGAWATWRPFGSLLRAAPQLTIWSDQHVNLIRAGLVAPTAGVVKLWQQIEPLAEQLLNAALLAAQREIDRYVSECL